MEVIYFISARGLYYNEIIRDVKMLKREHEVTQEAQLAMEYTIHHVTVRYT